VPTTITGLMSMNSAYTAECMTLIMTRPKISGSSAASSCRRGRSARFGSAGISIRRGRPDGGSRGGRLYASPPSPDGDTCASGGSGRARVSTCDPICSGMPGSHGCGPVSGSPSSSTGAPAPGTWPFPPPASGSTMAWPARPPGPTDSRAA
jgi:hypothetical protein